MWRTTVTAHVHPIDWVAEAVAVAAMALEVVWRAQIIAKHGKREGSYIVKGKLERYVVDVVTDGFKPSQRKVLYACFKKKLRIKIKMAQLAGYIRQHSAYRLGDMLLNRRVMMY